MRQLVGAAPKAALGVLTSRGHKVRVARQRAWVASPARRGIKAYGAWAAPAVRPIQSKQPGTAWPGLAWQRSASQPQCLCIARSPCTAAKSPLPHLAAGEELDDAGPVRLSRQRLP